MGDWGNPHDPWQDYGRDASRDEGVPAHLPAPLPPVPAQAWSPRWSEDYSDDYSDEWDDEDPDERGEGPLSRAVGEAMWRYQSAPLWLRATLDVSAVVLLLTFVVVGAMTLSGARPTDEVGAFVVPSSTTVQPGGTPTSAPVPLSTSTTTSTTTEPPRTTTTAPSTTVAPTTTTVPPETTTTTRRRRGDPGPPPHYDNCFEAWRDGALPLYAGDPGYGPHLDDDGDGVACEWGEGI